MWGGAEKGKGGFHKKEYVKTNLDQLKYLLVHTFKNFKFILYFSDRHKVHGTSFFCLVICNQDIPFLKTQESNKHENGMWTKTMRIINGLFNTWSTYKLPTNILWIVVIGFFHEKWCPLVLNFKWHVPVGMTLKNCPLNLVSRLYSCQNTQWSDSAWSAEIGGWWDTWQVHE